MRFLKPVVAPPAAILPQVLQIVGAIGVCVGLPYVVQTWNLPQGWHEPEARHTALASVSALIIGIWLQRTITALPGARASSSILPSQMISFGMVLIAILFFRIDYSRAILMVSFGTSVLWLYLMYLVNQRRSCIVVGTVEGGRVDLLRGMHGIETVPLSLGDDAGKLDAVSADFRFPHSPEWEARISDYVLAGIPVYHAKDLYESITGRVDLEHLSENTFGSLGPLAPFQKVKRVIDALVAFPVLLLLSPLMIVIAIAIRIDSPGPALFRQKRIGYRGKPFTVYKFRTMRQPRGLGSDERSELMTKQGDGRITRLGRTLRRSRFDELPQLLNILRGEMSWIGPRPEAAKLSEWYEGEIPFYRYRHVVFPGITGWAQVSQGHVAELDDVQTKLQYDFYYIRNFSIWLDVLIIAKTIRIMLTGFGAR